MAYKVKVPASWQFGALDPHVGRAGEVRRAVAGQLIDGLFGNDGRADVDASVEAFAGKLGALDVRQKPEVAILLAALGFGPKEDTGKVADPARESQARNGEALAPEDSEATAFHGPNRVRRSSPAEGAFCLALHGLTLALAGGAVAGSTMDVALDSAEEATQGPETESPDNEDLDGNADWFDEIDGGELAAEKTQATDLIARLLPLWRERKADAESHSPDSVRLVAKIVLECLLEVLPSGMFVVEEQQIQVEDGEPRTRQRIVVKDSVLIRRVGRLIRELPYRFTLQPLARPVSFRADAEGQRAALAADGGRFDIELIGYRRTNNFLKNFLERTAEACDFRDYVKAVDAQQAVAWRINRTLFIWARRLAELARGQRRWNEELRLAVRDARLDVPAIEAWQKWIRQKFYRPEPLTTDRKKYKLPGELLDNPLVQSALEELVAPKGRDGSQPEFFLPWKADYRGRIYAETPWLSPQGGDLQRALFEFAKGKALNEAGAGALRRHGANLVKREVILDDLGIKDRRVLTLAERERWIEQHEDQIVRSAGSPLAEAFWRNVASKPMQFLAFCFAYRDWKEDPTRPIHFPVQIDGTCNGLQHIAALMGDPRLAQAVNVVPRADGMPGDIYSEVAAAARKTVGQIAELSLARDKYRAPLCLADKWLARQKDALLDRNTAKRVVMTVPYGASQASQARYVLESIEETIAETVARTCEAAEISNWLTASDPKSRKFVWKCTRGLFTKLRGRVRQREEGALEALRRARALGAFVAMAIVVHLRSAFDKAFPAAKRFADWLRGVAECCSGLPLMWPTPLGLPVCQDKFACRRASLSVRLGEHRITLGAARLEENVSSREQAQALLPNLIHSLDATHLAMTINEAVSRGIREFGSIHDCLLCHPNYAPALATIARETFATLFRKTAESGGRPAVLTEWARWMQLSARIAALRNASVVKGALDFPGEFGERWLETVRASGEASRSDEASYGLAVLGDIRALPQALHTLARLLLEYAANVPLIEEGEKPTQRGKPARKKHPLPLSFPEVRVGDLAELATSEYFFS